jgi:AI-2 transport protein TqsA
MSQLRTTRLLLSSAALVIVLAGIKAAGDIVGPVVLALSLTIVFHPLRVVLERRMPSWATSIVVLVLAYALLIGLILALVVSIGRMATLIPTYAPQLDDLAAGVGDRLQSAGVDDQQAGAVAGALDIGRLEGVITAFMTGILGVVSNLFFLITLLLFLAFDSARAHLLAEGARTHRPDLVDALITFAQGTRSYLGVSAIFGLIVAVIDTAVLWALGIPGAFVWGVLAFVTNFIPNIGFVIGVIPPALIALLEGGPGLMLAVIALYSVINVIIQSIIQPRYVGQAVGLSTTLTFLSLIFWTWILGPIGALLAVPMSLLARAVLVDADPESRWRQPLISGDPEPQPAP